MREQHRTSRNLEALLDQRDHLRVKLSLEADRAAASPEMLMAMSRRLAQVEREIETEQSKAKDE
jgi:hypothetical protein